MIGEQHRLVTPISLSSVLLSIIGMTQVCQHYAHTFENFKFHIHYESDPTFGTLAQFLWSKMHVDTKRVKLQDWFLIYSKKLAFKILLVIVVAVQFGQAYLKTQTRYRGETRHDDWNP